MPLRITHTARNVNVKTGECRKVHSGLNLSFVF